MNRQATFRFWATGTPRRLPTLVPALAATVVGAVAGCAALSKIGVREPNAAVKNVRLTSLSFEQLGLGVQIAVQNPNPVAVTLAGYDYQLSLGDTPLLSGVQEQAVAVQRNAESVVEIPITLVFAELFQTLQSLADQDSTELGIAANLWCELPVLGRKKLPIKATRRAPLLKLPTLTVEAVRAKMVGLTSAEIGLQVRVRNPNALGFNITQLKYALMLHDKVPANGVLENLRLPAHGTADITVPVRVDLLQVGQALFSTLTSKQPLKFDLQADLVMASGDELLREALLQLRHSGHITP